MTAGLPGWDENTLARAREWARGIPNEAHAIDDETALIVDSGRVEVISEGHGEHFAADRHSEVSQEQPHSGAYNQLTKGSTPTRSARHYGCDRIPGLRSSISRMEKTLALNHQRQGWEPL